MTGNDAVCMGDSSVSGALCGCCEGTTQLTPAPIANRPGLSTLAYRMGTHAAFLETMKARLSNFFLDIPIEGLDAHGQPQIERIYPLCGLTTRATDDPSIALLDAWATVGDVLTFYQERIANEGYLRTATERRSILELARLVGYALRPGVSATVYLAYTLDNNFKDEVVIPVGARSQSIPGPGELPQFFETSDPLNARAAWNVLQPRMTEPQTWSTIVTGTKEIPGPRVYLNGISTNLKPNDPLLISSGSDSTPVPYRVLDVQPDAKANRTLVTLQVWQGAVPPAQAIASPEDVAAETKRQLGAIVTRHLGVEADQIGVSRNSQTFREVSKHLAALRQQLAEEVPFPAMMAHLNNETLPNLATTRQAAATRKGASELQPWLDNMTAELKSVAANASVARAESLAREFTLPAPIAAGGVGVGGVGAGGAGSSGDGGGAASANADPFRSVLTGLVKPASVPPANALQLKTSLNVAFQPKADTHLQMVGAFRQDLRQSLPTVVANTPVTPDVTIKVYALRVKAAPFGNNAPKRMHIDRGTADITVIGEWPIIEWPCGDGEQSGPSAPPLETESVIYLDANYDKILRDSWILIDSSVCQPSTSPQPQVSPVQQQPVIVKVKNAQADIARAEYGLSGKTTRIELDGSWLTFDNNAVPDQLSQPSSSQDQCQVLQSIYDVDFRVIRATAVYAQSEELDLAEEPIDDPICGSDSASDPNAYIELDGVYSDLQAGRWLIVSGERTDIQSSDPNNPGQMTPVSGVESSELVMLAEVVQRVLEADQNGYYGYGPQPVAGEKIHTFIRLAKKLEYCYKRDAVTIYGNVVKATNGETRNEVLGSGDASQALQSFTLKQSPLTYVAAPNPRGVDSTLHVRVNNVEWHEVDTLADLQPNDRNFITKTDDDSKTTVIFGNGREGARLPTGVENVTAVYRNGIGKAANVKAQQISLLATRPLGVKDVINPLPATGGADKESRDQARQNAPLAVLALDRLVSTQDYADFARTFAGIGKASAARLTDGRRQLVFVTIAGADDIPIDKSSDLYRNLVTALRDFGDPYQPFQVELRELLLLLISANVRIQPDYQWESVATNIRTQLLATFSFNNRDLGQDVLLSEVISVMQAVAGVMYVDVDTLGAVPEKKSDDGQRRLLTPDEIAAEVQRQIDASKMAGPAPRIVVNVAGAETNPISPAQLAFLTPDVPATLILNQIK